MLEKHPEMTQRYKAFWIAKYVIFNIIYIPIVILFRDLLFAQAVVGRIMAGCDRGRADRLVYYDRAYDYVQVHLWGKIRGRVL